MRKTFRQLYLLLSCVLLTVNLQAADGLQEIAAKYEVFFRDYINQENYPGAAFAIVSRERVAYGCGETKLLQCSSRRRGKCEHHRYGKVVTGAAGQPPAGSLTRGDSASI